MLIALVGIITIQAIWIKGNIDDRKKELAAHVHDALSSVNEDIRDDESMFILKQRFGNLDSLMNTIVSTDPKKKSKLEIKIDQKGKDGGNDDVIVLHDMPKIPSFNMEDMERFGDSMEKFGREMEEWGEQFESLGDNIDVNLEKLDSSIEKTIEKYELDEKHVDHISEMVEHFTFEMLLREG